MSDLRPVLFLSALVLTASGTLAAAQAPAAAPETAAEEGRWTYATHPVLGESAHVVVGGKAFGLACLRDGDPAGDAGVVAVRMSFGLVPRATLADGAVNFYARPFAFGGADTFEADPAGFVGRDLDVCGDTLALISGARELVFVDGELISGPTGGGGVTLRSNGVQSTFVGDDDLQAASGRIVIPLRGSSRAVQRLEAACPAIARARAALCPGE